MAPSSDSESSSGSSLTYTPEVVNEKYRKKTDSQTKKGLENPNLDFHVWNAARKSPFLFSMSEAFVPAVDAAPGPL
jgi:hypothetical protein